MPKAFRLTCAAVLTPLLGMAALLLSFELFEPITVPIATRLGGSDLAAHVGHALTWLLVVVLCGLPIAVIAREQAFGFGAVAGCTLAVLSVATTQPVGGILSMADPYVLTIFAAAAMFPLTSHAWWRGLSRKQGTA
jgi:hypothetical protein